MTTFLICAFLMLLMTLTILLRGLSNPVNAGSNPVDVNVEIAKENKRALERALATGEMTQSSFDLELQLLENGLANNIDQANPNSQSTQANNKRGQWIAAAVLVVAIPLASGLLYLNLGNPAAIDAVQQQTADGELIEGLPPLAELLPALEARLAESPNDLDGWKLLGRTYLMTGDFANAAKASRRALELDSQDVDVLAQLAESLAVQQEGSMQGEPTELANAALAINPDHQHAKWLSAIADQQQGNHKAAIIKFKALAEVVKDDPQALASIVEMTQTSAAALGMDTNLSPKEDTAATTTVSLEVAATIADAITIDLPEDTTVFIYARASSGPPMPLAVAKLQLKDLPATVTLDDSMAMIPDMSLSSFNEVVIGARISPSGNAVRQTGDWMGETSAINTSSHEGAVNVTIDTQVE